MADEPKQPPKIETNAEVSHAAATPVPAHETIPAREANPDRLTAPQLGEKHGDILWDIVFGLVVLSEGVRSRQCAGLQRCGCRLSHFRIRQRPDARRGALQERMHPG